ncbi:unnamed protein product [Dicrocoelium dendriticum]|nr:unnamed protein product [Dicrocoelium dendriticum]
MTESMLNHGRSSSGDASLNDFQEDCISWEDSSATQLTSPSCCSSCDGEALSQTGPVPKQVTFAEHVDVANLSSMYSSSVSSGSQAQGVEETSYDGFQQAVDTLHPVVKLKPFVQVRLSASIIRILIL